MLRLEVLLMPRRSFPLLPLLVFLVPALAVSAIWLLVAYVVEARASRAWSIGRKDGG